VGLKPPRFSEKNVFKDIRERKEKKLRARGDTSRR
jgi:23S rRNA pseudouridine2605 synthase